MHLRQASAESLSSGAQLGSVAEVAASASHRPTISVGASPPAPAEPVVSEPPPPVVAVVPALPLAPALVPALPPSVELVPAVLLVPPSPPSKKSSPPSPVVTTQADASDAVAHAKRVHFKNR